MENLAIVNVLDRKTNLRKIIKEFVFREGRIYLFSAIDDVAEIASVGELHDDVPAFALILVGTLKFYDVGMIEYHEHVRLRLHLLLVFLLHIIHVDPLNDENFASELGADFVGLTESPLTQLFDLLVLLFWLLAFDHRLIFTSYLNIIYVL